MASIERTAYPRFKRVPTAKELVDLYTPTLQEIEFGHRSARGDVNRLTITVLLKAFQRLGYFPRLEMIPRAVVHHIRSCLRLPADLSPVYDNPRTLYRHHKAIREYLEVVPYGKFARHVATEAMFKAAQVMDNPADLINVAIEELVKQRCELPAFSTLDRMAARIRTLVNYRYFNSVLSRLAAADRNQLDRLLDTDEPGRRTDFNYLKEPPKSATLSHMQDLQANFAWLLTLGDVDRILADIPNAKIKHFAAEARVLDAREIKDFAPPKRYTLLLSMIHRARVQARDNLVEMFLKRIGRIHNKGKEELVALRERHRAKTETLVSLLAEVVQASEESQEDATLGRQLRELLAARGGTQALLDDCEAITSYSGNNYLPLLWKFYRSHRSALFRMVRLLNINSTTQDQSLMRVLDFILENEGRRGVVLPATIDLTFASEQWQRTVLVRQGRGYALARRHLEVCVFTHLASELKTGDLYVRGSESYADYREQLLSWEECEPLVADYCHELGFEPSPEGFTRQLKEWLIKAAQDADRNYPDNGQVVINSDGEPILKRIPRKELSHTVMALEAAVLERIPERNILDVLCNVEHWTNWTRHFGPLSGSDPKLENATERYIITAFGYGCNLGPAQTARHMRGRVTPHMLSFVNRRHINARKLDDAIRDTINSYSRFSLPRVWGDGTAAAADGTKFDLYEENLISEYHIRYGGYGGIAYHHVSDMYIALFSHFIPCGVWEAVYIIDGLLKNRSEIRPDTLHADTQGQSTPVFALAHLLGIRLMPRIRNWKDLKFYRPSPQAAYKHIDLLFSDSIDWELLQTHWRDLFQVVLSIKAGKVLPSTLLRKLGNYSRKNRLYQAFRELGRVIRTVFLLQYITDIQLREQITASTNKVEAYNGFSKWFFFGGEGVISENDPEEQEKRIKYNDLVANAVIFQNVVDMTYALRGLKQEGYEIQREDVAALSPYLTRHIKRFGDYVIDLGNAPQPLEEGLPLPL